MSDAGEAVNGEGLYDPAQESWVVGGRRDPKSETVFLELGNKNNTNAMKKRLLNVEAVN